LGEIVSYDETEGGYAYVIFADSSISGAKKIRKSFIVKILTDDRVALPELATERWYKLAEDLLGVFDPIRPSYRKFLWRLFWGQDIEYYRS
jgi:hypothetical protein